MSVDQTGALCLYSSAATQLIVDLNAVAERWTNVVTTQPSRLLDTRNSPTVDGRFTGQGRVGANGIIELDVIARAGVPPSAVGVVPERDCGECFQEGQAMTGSQMSAVKHTCVNRGSAPPQSIVWCYGEGVAGQIGDGATNLQNPVPFPVGSSVDSVSVGGNHSCAVTNGLDDSQPGRLFCWDRTISARSTLSVNRASHSQTKPTEPTLPRYRRPLQIGGGQAAVAGWFHRLMSWSRWPSRTRVRTCRR
jgi:hypothetical protein